MEKDDEIAGGGNSYTAEFWQYDSRLGRRWNLDPKPNPSISDYATFANNPIMYIDPFGDTIRFAQGQRLGFKIKVVGTFFISALFSKEFRKNLGIAMRDENLILITEQDVNRNSKVQPMIQLGNFAKEPIEHQDYSDDPFNPVTYWTVAGTRYDDWNEAWEVSRTLMESEDILHNGVGDNSIMFLNMSSQYKKRIKEEAANSRFVTPNMDFSFKRGYWNNLKLDAAHELKHTVQIATGRVPLGYGRTKRDSGTRRHELEAVKSEDQVRKDFNRFRLRNGSLRVYYR